MTDGTDRSLQPPAPPESPAAPASAGVGSALAAALGFLALAGLSGFVALVTVFYAAAEEHLAVLGAVISLGGIVVAWVGSIWGLIRTAPSPGLALWPWAGLLLCFVTFLISIEVVSRSGQT